MTDTKDPSPPFGSPMEGIPLAGNFKPDVKHLGLPVAGYQAQSAENVALVNRSKEQEERTLRLLDELRTAGPQFDQRFVSSAMTYLQIGFMLLNRSIFQPKRIKLPEDPA